MSACHPRARVGWHSRCNTSGMSIGLSLAAVAVFVIALWAASTFLGFQMALVSSLVISLGLTLVLNLVLGVFRRRRRG